MSLFKVVPVNRGKKVAILASTVQEVIERAIVKLDLAKGIYEVVLDDDGTVIDEDDILLGIAKTSKSPVVLMLLSQGSTWKDPSSEITVDVPKTTQACEPTNAASSTSSTLVPETVPLQYGSNLWQQFPPRLLKSCEAGESVRSEDRRSMVVAIANYMLQDLKDSSRKTAERIARLIFEKYPQSFGDTIDNVVIGAGMESLRAQIYTAVQYRKDISKSKKRRIQREDNSEDSESEASSVSSVSRKQDEYGCVEYQPLLLESESNTSQNEKRLELFEYYNSHKADDEKIIKLMDETYVSQRLAINNPDRDIQKVFETWPFFKDAKTLIRHASRLLGKGVQEIWNDSLSNKAEAIRKYFKSAEIAKEYKNRKSKQNLLINDNENHVSSNHILGLLSEAKKQARCVTRSEIPELGVIFPIICHYMKEDLSNLFIVVDEDSSNEAVQGKILSASPILIIQGKGFYDDTAKYNVYLEKNTSITVDGLFEGLLLTFLSYYIFGYSYPANLCSTLEFIQRVFLHINPPK